MGGWKTILLLKIFLFFYVHIRVCFAERSYEKSVIYWK